MAKSPLTQRDNALDFLSKRGMVRLSEFLSEGITATTIARMEERGLVVQLSRGLYQLPHVPLHSNHVLALVAKLVPNGIICLNSSLAFHGLAEAKPITWIGIGPREWRPKLGHRTVQVVRFSPKAFDTGWKAHTIAKIPVKIYEPAKTIADMFHSGRQQQVLYSTKAGIAQAVASTREALRQRKATVPSITRYAEQIGVWKFMQPYLDAVTVDG
jgi:predicted transcriptional regulator of viral defense system